MSLTRDQLIIQFTAWAKRLPDDNIQTYIFMAGSPGKLQIINDGIVNPEKLAEGIQALTEMFTSIEKDNGK